MLTTLLSSQVAGGVKRRGRQYFASGAVQILHGDDRSVYALVQGNDQYDVNLTLRKNSLKVSCSCPYFEGIVEPCKHIWATILAAEARGHLRGSGKNGKLRLNVDEAYLPGGQDADLRDSEDEWDGGDQEWDEGPRETASYGGYRLPRQGSRRRRRKARKKSAQQASWRGFFAGLRGDRQCETAPRNAWPPGREILYVVDVANTMTGQGLFVEVAYRRRKKDGGWSKPKFERMAQTEIPKLPDGDDRQILSLLEGAHGESSYYPGCEYSYHDSAALRYRLSEPQALALLPLMCRTGRCLLRPAGQPNDDLRPVQWDDDDPWEFWLKVARDESEKQYLLEGELHRGDERMPLLKPVMLIAGGLVFHDNRVARLQDFGAFDWVFLLRKQGSLAVPAKQKEDLLKELFQAPHLPRLDLPEELRFEEVALAPRPRLRVKSPQQGGWGVQRLLGELSFDYGGEVVEANQPGRGIYHAEQRRLILRDHVAERAAAAQLFQVGFRHGYYHEHLELTPRNLPRVVRTLLDAGWHVEAEGKLYRQPGTIRIEVSSGIDWFELHGTVDFGETTAKLPELLAAMKRGENTIRLDDGTFGMLPEDWLKKYGMLAGLGTTKDGNLRFSRSQVGLLDALLASQPEATCDEMFRRVRDELHSFEGLAPADPPAEFVGRLRGYQREGLGWLYFLRKFGFGGCLADDMGLGKTVQVLALLESHRGLRAQSSSAANGSSGRPGPSLVVVPKSLVFNWKQEAARFTPNLRVLDHTGILRMKPGDHFDDYDLVLTTYGTLRRDALHFKDVRFDYCILDEAQAVKNANTESAKAVRLLCGDHRLALSGTPVENHLGELWSLFEFLNPGMLGSASVFRLGGAGARNPDEEGRRLLARALRPFILRRTKEQVAKDLPEKSEQTIYCELESSQRKCYDELREHYRRSLLARIDREGLNKSKVQILEALLRLRQAACHPGLIDKAKTSEPSAKLDVLLSQLGEVLEEGHKALVFSQFTSLLAIVRDRLDREEVPYAYLDGRTRDRAARVEHFQNDPDCKLFLISLKAGGLGLNLTAAEYVFLLDPWWNPAVEAQAIDRTHRIGQTRPVFAYRLIARDTVEEKVLELQKSKRALADAIITADNSLIRNLGREDLDLLLS
jgi:hypothetical protein